MTYDDIVMKACSEAKKAVQECFISGFAHRRLGIGAHGDTTYGLDKAAEDAMLKTIRDQLPDAYIVTEESGVFESVGDGKLTVIVDPVDGSTNALRGMPIYSASIAVAEGNKFDDVVVAGVMDLVHGDVFFNGEDGRTLFNGRPCRTSEIKDLKEACVCMDMRMTDARSEGVLHRLLRTIRFPRSFGSAALETAYVSAGLVDAFVEPRIWLRMFDAVAALNIVKKAGGYVKVLNIDLEQLDLRRRQRLSYIVACNEDVGRKILSHFV